MSFMSRITNVIIKERERVDVTFLKYSLLSIHGYLLWYIPLQWRYNGRDCVSKHQPQGCLLSHLFRRRSNNTSKLRVTGLCAGNSPVTGEFPTQMVSNAENVSLWWRHHTCIPYNNTGLQQIVGCLIIFVVVIVVVAVVVVVGVVIVVVVMVVVIVEVAVAVAAKIVC